MSWSLEDIASICDGELIGLPSNQNIQHVLTDSRRFRQQASTVFVALSGPKFDGHDYINELIEEGLNCFIVSKVPKVSSLEKASFIRVNNTLDALQALAAHRRKEFNGKVIGITGSNGKTIVKEWLYQLLRSQFSIIRSPKSFNSQVGAALSLLLIKPEHDIAIIEAGISEPDEMIRLERMIRPNFGILTNIGTAHLSNFKDQNALRNEKMQLFTNCEHIFSYDDLDYSVEQSGSNSVIHISGNKFTIPFTDKASVSNAAISIVTAISAGGNISDIQKACSTLEPIALRLEQLKGINQSLIINDAYNSDLIGLEIALSDLASKARNGRNVVILSDIVLDTSLEETVYKQIFELLKMFDVDLLISVGTQINNYAHLFEGNSLQYVNTSDLLNDGRFIPNQGDTILIKGARDFHFEQIVNQFEDKPHATWLEIDLDKLSHNVGEYRKQLSPNCMLMAMVKAMSYGAGDSELAEYLEGQGIDYFGVAYTNEGKLLRDGGIKLPILVMNSDEASYASILDYNLEPVIYSLQQLDGFIRFLLLKGVQEYPIHIELDTGMHRLGFDKESLPELIAMLQSQPEVRVQSIFSHLANADRKDDQLTLTQLKRFELWSDKIMVSLSYPIIRHICNTAGIVNYPQGHYDMVRLGIGMHGFNQEGLQLENVASLYSTIQQVKTIPASDGVGYGETDVSDHERKIGIIPIGYADGLSRQLSNGKGEFLHVSSGQLTSVVGRVCMDMTMIDLTGIDAKEGDVIEIFGPNMSVENLAEQMGTISYEVLTSISARVNRRYLHSH